nr:MAG TPA: hypothetical protein [Caudoviricetes sp.]
MSGTRRWRPAWAASPCPGGCSLPAVILQSQCITTARNRCFSPKSAVSLHLVRRIAAERPGWGASDAPRAPLPLVGRDGRSADATITLAETAHRRAS